MLPQGSLCCHPLAVSCCRQGHGSPQGASNLCALLPRAALEAPQGLDQLLAAQVIGLGEPGSGLGEQGCHQLSGAEALAGTPCPRPRSREPSVQEAQAVPP